MIERISDNSGVSPAANPTQKAASTKTLCHTPFGDVMVDELSTTNLANVFGGGRRAASSAPATGQAAVAAPAAQYAVAAATLKASAVAASTEQTAGAAAAVPAAVAASTEQTAGAAAAVPAAVAASTEQTVGAAADIRAADSSDAPTAESVFGSQPWLTTPTGSNPDGSQFSYNPLYFATPQTAQQIAAMVGGQVVEQKALAPNGPIQQNTLNEMIKLPNGTLVNAGLIAGFYEHGYPQSFVDQMIQNEIQGT